MIHISHSGMIRFCPQKWPTFQIWKWAVSHIWEWAASHPSWFLPLEMIWALHCLCPTLGNDPSFTFGNDLCLTLGNDPNFTVGINCKSPLGMIHISPLGIGNASCLTLRIGNDQYISPLGMNHIASCRILPRKHQSASKFPLKKEKKEQKWEIFSG